VACAGLRGFTLFFGAVLGWFPVIALDMFLIRTLFPTPVRVVILNVTGTFEVVSSRFRYVPQQASQFLVQHNQIQAPGNNADGIFIADFGPYFGVRKKADVVISDNTIQLSGSHASPAYAGVESLFRCGHLQQSHLRCERADRDFRRGQQPVHAAWERSAATATLSC
jgi:hypothetical protein